MLPFLRFHAHIGVAIHAIVGITGACVAARLYSEHHSVSMIVLVAFAAGWQLGLFYRNLMRL